MTDTEHVAEHAATEGGTFALPEAVYNSLKFLAQILLPAAGALYFALAGTWNLPDAEQVVGTITSVDVFLGVLLGVSSRSYNASDAKYDGVISVNPTNNTANIGNLVELLSTSAGKADLTLKLKTVSPAVPVSLDTSSVSATSSEPAQDPSAVLDSPPQP